MTAVLIVKPIAKRQQWQMGHAHPRAILMEVPERTRLLAFVLRLPIVKNPNHEHHHCCCRRQRREHTGLMKKMSYYACQNSCFTPSKL
ncbi:hypothetical protein KP509_08G013400 [Ceratopteris richardii]|uniref:Uncharacterized protein n=1 Tax=Ceratopteris richardii TaxID=49495 RepID=A0A8T2UA47_CERRI|nr:hypothetical protein KP509_08G013400 [Ceratopteris richardii]